MGYLSYLYRQFFDHPPPIPLSTSLKGQTVLVTGANSGIGLEAARQCVRLDASLVILAVRSKDKGEAAKEDILKSNSGSQSLVEVWLLDLESFKSVIAFGKRAQELPRLDVAMLNAGVFKFEWGTSPAGVESSLQTNHLSTALLSLLLLPVLRTTSHVRKSPPRLTFSSSEVHMWTSFKEKKADNILEHLNDKQHCKDFMDRYCVSKLLNVFWVLELVANVSRVDVTINLVNPGSVDTGLHRDNKIFQVVDRIVGRTSDEGGRLLIDAAVVKGSETHGKYLSEARLVEVSAFVRSEEGAKIQKKLWSETREMLGKHLPAGEVARAFSNCNRSWPCNHCLSRKSPQLCRFGVGKSSVQQLTSQSNVDNSRQEQLGRTEAEHVNIDSSNTVVEAMLTEKSATAESSSSTVPHNPQSTTEQILQQFPKRSIVDFLVQHFLSDVNWLYEEVHVPSFLERYNSWWEQTQYQAEVDLQFGILILRMCVNALQFLPHSNGPDQSEIGDGIRLDGLENTYNDAASKLDNYLPRKFSLLRVQQLLLHIVILLNDGNAKESHQILGEAIKEAQDVELFLESKWTGLSEFDKEERRKFWALTPRFRFYCTFLGRWPLIPEHYHAVSFPSETPYSISSTENAPTQFSDVILNFKLSHYMASFMSAPGKESERTDPYIIAAHAKEFESKFVSTLPPCFRLENPDRSWDMTLPTLPMKRLWIYILLHGTMEAMHKCFVGPLTIPSISSYVRQWKEDKDRASLVLKHRHTLANACINSLKATKELHTLMGGGPHPYFVLSIAAVEAPAMLGMMMISDLLITTSRIGHQDVPLLEQGLLDSCYQYFQDGFKLLQLLAQRSVLAQKGIRILEGLNRRIHSLKDLENPKTVGREDFRDSLPVDSNNNNKRHSMSEDHYSMSEILSSVDNVGSNFGYADSQIIDVEDVLQPSFMELEWESISTGNDFCWFFEDWNGIEAVGQFEGTSFA
ncbi:uncharacterized protein BP5553_10164 [Venustampulla echinocandica]|uniref:Xylanolytic transcriptional activator regulatory domain-containing protein n=1 Tax=Venustampulla echinocandica TaxID=2656787 RepID=A0A370TAJ1_9HELO|nr:uncharacterized protein BP5553_10164 [Venustampulla echinocandica]RDL30819.1 hypothetical protein BP5553_10164 [Venustampulla echinocandica]